MHPQIQDHPFIESPRGVLPRWACALGVVHAILCAVGLTFHLL
jgi:hypothetical protein